MPRDEQLQQDFGVVMNSTTSSEGFPVMLRAFTSRLSSTSDGMGCPVDLANPGSTRSCQTSTTLTLDCAGPSIPSLP